MDPVECLAFAKMNLSQCGHREDAAECLTNYFTWRVKGGFEPPGGDAKFYLIAMALGKVADTLSETLDHNANRL